MSRLGPSEVMRLPTSLSSDQLTSYLNDHLAGSTFGLELARRISAGAVAVKPGVE